MAGSETSVDVRRELVAVLLEKIARDRYPSTTMMDMVEDMIRPDDVPTYAAVLLDKIRGDRHPSISMMLRVRSLG